VVLREVVVGPEDGQSGPVEPDLDVGRFGSSVLRLEVDHRVGRRW
jgi:hypothetical protein